MILAEVPPPNDKVTVTTPVASVPEKVDLKNCTVSSVAKMKNELKNVKSTSHIIIVHCDPQIFYSNS